MRGGRGGERGGEIGNNMLLLSLYERGEGGRGEEGRGGEGKRGEIGTICFC